MIEKTFIAIDLAAAHPPGVCSDCAQHGMEHAPSGLTYVYCEHANRGVIRQPGEGWISFEGIASLTFKQYILETIFSFEDACGEIAMAEIESNGETAH